MESSLEHFSGYSSKSLPFKGCASLPVTLQTMLTEEGRWKVRKIHIFCNGNFALKVRRGDYNVQLFPFFCRKRGRTVTHNLSGWEKNGRKSRSFGSYKKTRLDYCRLLKRIRGISKGWKSFNFFGSPLQIPQEICQILSHMKCKRKILKFLNETTI